MKQEEANLTDVRARLQSDTLSFSDKMVKVHEGGDAVRAAAEWLSKLGHPLVGGLGIQQKEKEPPPPISRVEWTAAMERVAEVARGCDKIYLISDRTPGVSVERMMDEVQQLASEMGPAWRPCFDCVSMDASPVAARMLRRIASETNGRYSPVSAHTLRQQLLWDWSRSCLLQGYRTFPF